MGKNIGHRTLDGLEVVPYIALTTVGFASTLGLATVTMGLAMTCIGIPVAFLTGAATIGAAGATTFFGSKTVHKTSHVFGSEGKCHSLKHAGAVMKAPFKG